MTSKEKLDISHLFDHKLKTRHYNFLSKVIFKIRNFNKYSLKPWEASFILKYGYLEVIRKELIAKGHSYPLANLMEDESPSVHRLP